VEVRILSLAPRKSDGEWLEPCSSGKRVVREGLQVQFLPLPQKAWVAQMEELLICNQRVAGSIPVLGSTEGMGNWCCRVAVTHFPAGQLGSIPRSSTMTSKMDWVHDGLQPHSERRWCSIHLLVSMEGQADGRLRWL
jgi:hypothetical protein